jgi:DNA-binding NarL/FixJ family response regulator
LRSLGGNGACASVPNFSARILELNLQGYTTREISERLGRAERTVRLLREGLRKRLQRMQQERP